MVLNEEFNIKESASWPEIFKTNASPSGSDIFIIPIDFCLSSTEYVVDPKIGGFSGISIILIVIFWFTSENPSLTKTVSL